MPHSVMIWLVDPGEQFHQGEALHHSADRELHPGAAAGVNEPPAFTRLVYGLFETREEADAALEEIGARLERNAPLRVSVRGNRDFLVPAHRVHYAVRDEVVRPKDQVEGRAEQGEMTR